MRTAIVLPFVAGAATVAACNAFSSTNDDPAPAPATDAGTNGGDSAATGDSGPPTCSDVLSDPKNCGKCGHDCLGGACAAGKCQATVLATTAEPVPWLALNTTHVVWLTSLPHLGAPGNVYACAKATGCGLAPTTIAAGFKGGALGSDGTTVYASDVLGAGGLATIEAGAFEQIPSLQKGGILWITPRDGALLVNAYYEQSGYSRSIYRIDLSQKKIEPTAAFTSDTLNPDPTVFTKTHVYLSILNTGAIYAAPLTGGAPDGGTFSEVLAEGKVYTASMTTDGDRVYFASTLGASGISSCAGDGQPCAIRIDVVADGKLPGAPVMVLAADGLLFIETARGDLVSCDPKSCADTITPIVHENAFASEWSTSGHNIAVDGQAIYYVAKEAAPGPDGGDVAEHVVKRIAREPK